jgi:hypothetical protein
LTFRRPCCQSFWSLRLVANTINEYRIRCMHDSCLQLQYLDKGELIAIACNLN